MLLSSPSEAPSAQTLKNGKESNEIPERQDDKNLKHTHGSSLPKKNSSGRNFPPNTPPYNTLRMATQPERRGNLRRETRFWQRLAIDLVS
jgi:hypothetical protein